LSAETRDFAFDFAHPPLRDGAGCARADEGVYCPRKARQEHNDGHRSLSLRSKLEAFLASVRAMCAPPHRNSIGKSKGRYKRVIKSATELSFVTGDRANRADLYFFLMYRNRDSHRFFIVPHLIGRLHSTTH
jgi:hypothetical protein